MEEGQIVLAVLSSDREQKRRPALILRKTPKYNDYLVCGISSKLHEEINAIDLIIGKDHADFKTSGLKTDGLVRLFFAAIIRDEDCLGTLGEISGKTLKTLQLRFANYITGK
jgi:mRNA interferase MazF